MNRSSNIDNDQVMLMQSASLKNHTIYRMTINPTKRPKRKWKRKKNLSYKFLIFDNMIDFIEIMLRRGLNLGRRTRGAETGRRVILNQIAEEQASVNSETGKEWLKYMPKK
ncbi:hypothetical protein LOAG_14435 [Loa loa]|uniref:Uncharacterized protein n=1 Tax=Loa loa TaxID=7209 RepID=A0A1S0TI82_LOALO|nr:hypothetical protein LOAG_14435 [Loa loa]EFO14089.1 hypothetical protein LOAG_14435 [Loa loa]